MKNNRLLTLGMTLMMGVAILTGCGEQKVNTNIVTEGAEKKYNIVCTTFPQYDWLKEIIGDQSEHFDLTLLLDNSVDLHSYQPTAEDIAKISTADMFVYGGGSSELWVEHALKEKINKDMKVINLMEALGDLVKEEELVEGMQESKHNHEHEEEHEGNHEHEEEHGHEDNHEHEEEHDHEETHEHESITTIENDEHIWLSLKNAAILVEALTDTLEQIAPEYSASYEDNEQAYLSKLAQLDNEYQTAVDEAHTKTILFGDRFPFRYLTDDYGLEYYAAFVGCSADTEASFETVAFLSDKVDALDLDTILVLEGSNHKIAQTIQQTTKKKDQEILQMNSIQSVSQKEIETGFTYLQAMQDNLEVLKKAID